MKYSRIILVKVSDIEVDDLNVRKTNRDEKIDELAASIKKKAIKIGYENFWSLYTYSSKGKINLREEIWYDFVTKIDNLKSQYSKI